MYICMRVFLAPELVASQISVLQFRGGGQEAASAEGNATNPGVAQLPKPFSFREPRAILGLAVLCGRVNRTQATGTSHTDCVTAGELKQKLAPQGKIEPQKAPF